MELERLKDKQVCNTIDSNANQELRRHRRNRELSNLRKLIQMDLPSSSLVILLSVMRRKNEQINQYIAVALLMSFTQSIVIAIISISLNDNLECTVLIDSRKNWGTKGYSRVFSGWPIARTSIDLDFNEERREKVLGWTSVANPTCPPAESIAYWGHSPQGESKKFISMPRRCAPLTEPRFVERRFQFASPRIFCN